jgi:hypothetical protein
LYGGVEYLNEFFYKIPDTHCTKPIKMAKGHQNARSGTVDNALACGSDYQKSLLTNTKDKALQKAAKKSYCQITPTSPQERYFECRNSPQDCVSSAVAQASGQAALVQSFLTLLLVFLAVNLLEVPKSNRDDDEENGGKGGGGGFFGRLANKAKDAFKTAQGGGRNNNMDEDGAKKQQRVSQDGEGGNIEMSSYIQENIFVEEDEEDEESTAPSTSTPYIMRQQEDKADGVTLETLQLKLLAQDTKVEELNRKIDMLLSVAAANNTDKQPVDDANKTDFMNNNNNNKQPVIVEETTKQFSPSPSPVQSSALSVRFRKTNAAREKVSSC